MVVSFRRHCCGGQCQAALLWWPVSDGVVVMASFRRRCCGGQFQTSLLWWPVSEAELGSWGCDDDDDDVTRISPIILQTD